MAEPSKRDIERWIAALRSGKYKQGKGQLQSDTGFCCLGVACKINRFNKRVRKNGQLDGVVPHVDNQPNAPEWLLDVDGRFAWKTGLNLWYLNDGGADSQYTFDEIADLLQAVYIEGVLDAE